MTRYGQKLVDALADDVARQIGHGQREKTETMVRMTLRALARAGLQPSNAMLKDGSDAFDSAAVLSGSVNGVGDAYAAMLRQLAQEVD